jgi:hypothetical protein
LLCHGLLGQRLVPYAGWARSYAEAPQGHRYRFDPAVVAEGRDSDMIADALHARLPTPRASTLGVPGQQLLPNELL